MNTEGKIVNGRMLTPIKYKNWDGGLVFHDETDPKVCNVLTEARSNNVKVVIHYGDTSTGEDWNNRTDSVGRIYKNSGSVGIPMLVNKDEEDFGYPVMDHMIVKITMMRGRVLYKHPKYHG